MKFTLACSGVCKSRKSIQIDPEEPGLGRALLLLLLREALITVVAPMFIKVL